MTVKRVPGSKQVAPPAVEEPSDPPPPMLPGRSWTPPATIPGARSRFDEFSVKPARARGPSAPPPFGTPGNDAGTETPGATTPGATTPGATTPDATNPGATTPGSTTPGSTSPPTTSSAVVAPLPPATTEVVNGVTIESYGASAPAVQEAESIARREVTRPDLIAALQARKVTVVIIPADRKMTDLPEFASLRGTHTFDGRVWDTVRGSGGTSLPDGRIAIGVSEENLAHLPSDGYGARYSVGLHELAHGIQNYSLPPADRQAVTDAYNARKAAGGPWTEAYGSSNDNEYFAQASNAWFGVNDGIGHNGADWVKANDPAMAAILQRVYGDPPASPSP